MKIVVTGNGNTELTRLGADIEPIVDQILGKVPIYDLNGISHIYITDLPDRQNSKHKNSWGAYFQKDSDRPAYIEIYLKNLFRHIKTSESLQLMLPIQSIGLAQTIFHEIGHHIEHTRSHGIKKPKKESFADSYCIKLLNSYIICFADQINNCFDELEKIAEDQGLSIEILQRMWSGWVKQYQTAVKMSE